MASTPNPLEIEFAEAVDNWSWEALIEYYAGNPQILKIVAT